MSMFILGRIYSPADPKETFTGRTIIVTGSNTGLGLEAAAKFIEKDAQKVIMGVRNVSKGETAKKAIVDRYGHQDRLEIWELDMTDYESIKKFAERANHLDRLDVALLNAGVYMTEYKKSPYEWEETLQVNTISTTLLGILLIPKLRQSQTAENTPILEFTNSGTHFRVKPPPLGPQDATLKYLNDAGRYNASTQYGYDSFIFRNVLKPIIFSMFRTQEQGSRTLVSGTTLGARSHGRFWQHDKIQPKAAVLSDDDSQRIQKKVWQEVIDAIRKDVPEIEAAIKQMQAQQ